MEKIIDYNFKGIRFDGRFPSVWRSSTILLGPKGGFCDITKGQTRVILFGYISPSMILKKVLFNRVCFSFKFFYEGLIKNKILNSKKKKKIFFFLPSLILPIVNLLKKSEISMNNVRSPGFKQKVEFKIGIINNDGNLQDTINLGVGMTLGSLEVPLVEFYGQSGIIKWGNNGIKNLIQRGTFLSSTSFSTQGMFDGGLLFLIDPTYLEEYYSDSLITILVLEKGLIKHINYKYENGLNEENLTGIYKLAIKNYSFLGHLVKKTLKQKIIKSLNLEIVTIT